MIIIDIEKQCMTNDVSNTEPARLFDTRRDAIVFANKLINRGFELISQTDTKYFIKDKTELQK